MADSMNDDKKREKPQIIFTQYTQYLVTDLENLRDDSDKEFRIDPVTTLCRCGGSKHKPYCDGSHLKIGFVGNKEPDRVKDKVRNYVGKDIIIHDNRGVCSHNQACVNNLPSVFNREERVWINPDGASVRDIIETIEKCPSGALSYSIGGRRYQDLDREPAIILEKNGPLKIEGGIIIKDDMNSIPESKEHYTLCRCGGSKNKPFCDGTHIHIDFKDD